MEKELYQTTLHFTVFEPDMLSGSLTLTAQEWGLESHFRQLDVQCEIKNFSQKKTKLQKYCCCVGMLSSHHINQILHLDTCLGDQTLH